MAAYATAAAQASHSPTTTTTLFGSLENKNITDIGRRRRRRSCSCFQVVCTASTSSEGFPRRNRRQKAPPGVDTRIHWENEEDGWIGGNSSSGTSTSTASQQDILGDKFSDLLKDYTDSHYQFLGVTAEADLEEIKAAYRRLSKEYHPDTTSLPLKEASDKFMQLRQVYNVLSNEESRRFYDWTLAQEAASEKMRVKLRDPYEEELDNYQPVPDVVDRLGGRNMELSDQAYTALTIDALIIGFAVCCIVYVTFFKQPY